MTTKVDFELLKNQVVLDTLREEIHCTLDEEKKQVLWEWINNYGLFLDTLAKSSTFAHLAHKQLSKSDRPFDKLKELWNEWEGFAHSNFEMFIWCHYMEGEWSTFITDTDNQVHKWLAEHCGFLTTAEVRQAIQILKNQ